MGAIKMRHQLVSLNGYALEARRIEDPETLTKEHYRLSPTAIGFLVPLFVVFLIGPFMCVFFVRRRRRAQRQPHSERLQRSSSKKAPESREDARRRLESVTEIASSTSQSSPTFMSDKDGKNASAEVISVLEKECAVCLSTLYSPAPPAPAKITQGIMPLASSKSAALSHISLSSISSTHEPIEKPEQILRLKVCGHEFHAECLVSWCQIRKYSCPICRAAYYIRDEESEEKTTAVNGRERSMEEGTVGVEAEEQNGQGGRTR